MSDQKSRNFAAIILAAGKGKRMQLENANKVTAELVGKPVIQHTIDFISSLDITTFVVVVGHEKESVMSLLDGQNIIFAEQEQQLGTADAVATGLKKLPENITDVLVVYGDDAVLYGPKNTDLIKNLLELHAQSEDVVTMLTIEQENPSGLGRIVRDEHGTIKAIVEEKDASGEQKKITEINPGCFLFSTTFLKEYLPKIKPSIVTGEYYLTELLGLAIKDKKSVRGYKGGNIAWRGINTKEELAEAEKLYIKNMQ